MAAQICVARIGAAHGVRGAVKLWTFTEDPFAVKAYGPLLTKDGTRSFEVATAREALKDLLAVPVGVVGEVDARDGPHAPLGVGHAARVPVHD